MHLKLPQLKCKNNSIKNKTKNLIYIIKLLCFIDNNKKDTLYEKIENKLNLFILIFLVILKKII